MLGCDSGGGESSGQISKNEVEELEKETRVQESNHDANTCGPAGFELNTGNYRVDLWKRSSQR
jgi:hypothetical protein